MYWDSQDASQSEWHYKCRGTYWVHRSVCANGGCFNPRIVVFVCLTPMKGLSVKDYVRPWVGPERGRESTGNVNIVMQWRPFTLTFRVTALFRPYLIRPKPKPVSKSVCLGQVFWSRTWICKTMKPALEADSLDWRWRTVMSKCQWKLYTICFINSQSIIWQ